jgi:hypothetical protein
LARVLIDLEQAKAEAEAEAADKQVKAKQTKRRGASPDGSSEAGT